MRFLHTSDWHLGRIFHGLHLLEEQKTVLQQLIDVAKETKVDAIVMAGDVYDRSVPPTEAVRLLNETLQTLILEMKLPVILIAGNHDNPIRLQFGQELFAANGLHIIGTPSASVQPIVLHDDFGPVYFAPMPYCEPLTATEESGEKITSHQAAADWQVRCMLEQIPSNARKVAIAHVFAAGAEPTPDSERQLAAGGAASVALSTYEAFDYTALGHLHAAQNCSDRIRYSGSLMKYSFAEASQKKTVQIVELDADGLHAVETVRLQAPHELAVLKGNFDDLLQHPRTEHQNDYLQILLTDGTPILDAKHRLEAVYPHILQLGYEQLAMPLAQSETMNRRGLSTEELFTSFFETMKGQPLTDTQKQLLQTTLDETLKEERDR